MLSLSNEPFSVHQIIGGWTRGGNLRDWSPWNLNWWRHTLCPCKNLQIWPPAGGTPHWNLRNHVICMICCSTKYPEFRSHLRRLQYFAIKLVQNFSRKKTVALEKIYRCPCLSVNIKQIRQLHGHHQEMQRSAQFPADFLCLMWEPKAREKRLGYFTGKRNLTS